MSDKPTVELPSHTLLYGDPGGGKSHLAATASVPSIVFNFDGLAKARPYFILPKPLVARRSALPYKAFGRDMPIEFVKLYDPADTDRKSPVRLIYNLVDNDPAQAPVAWSQFNDVLWPSLDGLMRSINAATFILDSGTTLQMAYRHFNKKYGSSSDSEWDWARPLTDKLEQLCCSLLGKPYNTILVCHVQKDKENAHGYAESVAALTGRMSRNALAMNDNTLRVFVEIDGKHYVQTQHDGKYIANNSVNAPARCTNDFAEICRNAPTIQWEEA